MDRPLRDRWRAHDVALPPDRADRRDGLLPKARRVAGGGGVRAAAANRDPGAAVRRVGPRRVCAGMSATRSRANPGGARVLELGDVRPFRERKPPWFKVKMPGSPRYLELKQEIEGD